MNEAAIGSLCQFVHDAQKERGIVSLFLRDSVGRFTEHLDRQFHISDQNIQTLSALPKKQSAKIEPLMNAVHYLPSRRKYVISRMVGPDDAQRFYTSEIINPAIDIVQELSVFDPDNNPVRVSAFVNFLHWKERVGRERALGGYLLQGQGSETPEVRNLLEYIIAKQNAYERMFLSLCDEETKAAFELIKKRTPAFEKINSLNKDLVRNGSALSQSGLDPLAWFELFTEKMDALHQLGLSMVDSLGRQNPAAVAPAKASETRTEPADIGSNVSNHMAGISSLPLFSEIAETDLRDILRFARVTHHDKGALIFMQGEQASRFYIVLKGWVKLFKGDAEGQESILQVLGTGDALLETAIFNSAILPVNAQAIEYVELLSIPSSIMREKLQSNSTLAMNMLSTVAMRSQSMISQFEQLTLKSVSQRVGRFLLKELLHNEERSTHFKLPYDKSLIAGYLGMKPETFSRALQTLRDDGIDVERNEISLPSLFALCQYCDMELAGTCPRHESDECPNPDL